MAEMQAAIDLIARCETSKDKSFFAKDKSSAGKKKHGDCRPSNPHALTVRLMVIGMPTHGHGTTTQGKTETTNKVKNTLK